MANRCDSIIIHIQDETIAKKVAIAIDNKSITTGNRKSLLTEKVSLTEFKSQGISIGESPRNDQISFCQQRANALTLTITQVIADYIK